MGGDDPSDAGAESDESEVTVYFPDEVIAKLDELAEVLQADRSDIILAAVKRALLNPP